MKKLIFLFILFPVIGSSHTNWEVDNIQDNTFIKNESQFNGRNWQKSKVKYGIKDGSYKVFSTKKSLSCQFDKMIQNGGEHKESRDKYEPEWMNKSELKVFYQDKSLIVDSYNFTDNLFSVNLTNYDNIKEAVIDSWTVNKSSSSSFAVWEVETDDNENIYTISNEMGVQLKKYNSASTWRWTYDIPWDTAPVWIGTLVADSGCIPPTLSITGTNVTCAGGSDGSADLTVTSGSGSSYTYSWTGPNGFTASSEDIFELSAGTYNVTVTDASNSTCTATDTITINDGEPTEDASFTLSDFCEGATNQATITGVTGGTFSFSPDLGDGSTIDSSTGEITNDVGGTTYTVQYTTSGTCPGISTQTVTVNANPTPTIAGSTTFCTGSSTTIDAGSGYNTYQWNTGDSTQTYVVNTTGTYTVTVTDTNSCSGSASISVTEDSSLSPVISGDTVFCTGGSTTLDAGTGYNSYTWSTGETSQSILVSVAGTYSVTVADTGGCTGSDQVTVTELSELSPVITGSTSICADSSTTLNVDSGYSSYLWSTGASTSSITVSSSGTYSVTVTDAGGCSGSTQVTVQSSSPISFNVFTDDADVCPGEPVEINGAVTGGLLPYTLYDETNNNDVTNLPYVVYPTETMTYTLTVQDACGDSQSGSVDIIVYPAPEPSFISDIIVGCQPLTVQFNEMHDYALYIWSFGDNSDDNLSFNHNPQHTFQNSGVFDVSVTTTNEYGCSNSFTFTDMITVYSKPEARFTVNPTIVSIIHPLVNFYNYSILNDFNYWSFGDGDSNLSANPYHLYPDTGTYTVTLIVETQNGCKDTTTMSSILIYPETSFYASTAFSPDGDGLNDFWFVTGTGIDTTNFHLYVYDRWGEVIWESDDIKKVWDGTTTDGKLAEDGTYVWFCYYYDIFAIAHEKTGQITIIK